MMCTVSNAKRIRDPHLVFSGGNGELFNIDWWQFK